MRPTSSWGLIRSVWAAMKTLLLPWSGSSSHSARGRIGSREWKRQVAADMIDSLSERRLARTLAAQVCCQCCILFGVLFILWL